MSYLLKVATIDIILSLHRRGWSQRRMVSVRPNHTPLGRAGRLTVAAPPGSPAPGVIMHASISRSRHSRGYPVREERGPATPFPRLCFRANRPR